MNSLLDKVRLRGGAISMAVATVVSLLAFQSAAVAADESAAAVEKVSMEEVIITGSSIAQKADTSALPVITLTAADIAKTGYTSTTELIQNLPAMQGFVPSSSSVNGGGGGVVTAALHAIPSKYTLVLLDGKRMAPFTLGSVQGGGAAVSIQSIPIEAIERVEVLADGASALYGADAVAGVVNFILKKNNTDGSVFYHTNMPQGSGGGGWSAGFTKGFGDLASDGYNVLVTYTHDVQNALYAKQRDVSSQGAYFSFSGKGKDLVFFNSTSNTTPANISLKVDSTLPSNVTNPNKAPTDYNPYYSGIAGTTLPANQNCGQGAFAAPLTDSTGATTCRFNYAATVMDIPGYIQDSGVLKGTFKVGDTGDIWGEVLLSDFNMTAQYAPPAQPMAVRPISAKHPAGTLLPLWDAYVVPYEAATGITATSATLGYRAVPAGGRSDQYDTQTRHIAVGYDDTFFGWDFKSSLTLSHGKLTDTAAGGYLDGDVFNGLVTSGVYDPVLNTGASSIQAAILHTPFSWTTTDVNSLAVGAQHKVFDMEGGPSILSMGAEYTYSKYEVTYSNLILSQSGFSTQPADTNYPVGGSYGQVPYESDRKNWGLFGEWLFPVLTNLNVTGSVRYDSYDKVNSDVNFSKIADANGVFQQLPGSQSLGNTFSDTTYKISVHWQPIEMVALRGSYGTGFRAPAMGDIAGAQTFFGSTSGSYPCPFPGSPGCGPASAQYDLVAGPNGLSGAAGLQPEKSTQYTIGTVVTPIKHLSAGVDYWHVKIKNQIQSSGIAEQVGFANPQQYSYLFINGYQDPVAGTTIAFIQQPFNGGEANYSGLDWNVTYATDAGRWGVFTAGWTGTYMIDQNYTNSDSGPKLTDLGVYGPDQAVVFRVVSTLTLGLKTGAWTNTLATHYKSGYTDQPYAAGDEVVFARNPDGSPGAGVDYTGTLPSYTTMDWQTVFEVNKAIGLTAGVTNMWNKEPPLSLQTGGGGNQIGYDGRYYDPTGRSYYIRGTYHF